MRPLSHLGLRWKLLLAFGALMVLLGCHAALTWHTTTLEHDEIQRLEQVHEDLNDLEEVLVAFHRMVSHQASYVISGDREAQEGYQASAGQLAALLERQERSPNTPPTRLAQLEQIRRVVSSWQIEVAAPLEEARRSATDGRISQEELGRLPRAHRSSNAFMRAEQVISVIKSDLQVQVRESSTRSAQYRETLRAASVAVTIVLVVLGFGLAILLPGSITRRLQKTMEVLEAVAAGDYSQAKLRESPDEIGRLNAAINHLVAETSLRVDALLRCAEAVAAGDLMAEPPPVGPEPLGQLGHAVGRLRDSMRDSIATIAQSSSQLSQASASLSGACSTLVSAADRASDQSAAAAQTGATVTGSVQAVATAAGQLSTSIHEIAQNAAEAARVATAAVEVAGSTNTTVLKLGRNSQEIGKVVKLITSIAQQTHLLALNATIEAARAGEAGRGFAVVAGEVKSLAQETSRATEHISERIASIQQDTDAAVAAIGEISEVIHRIHEISGTIASAVEEQTATTNEIARSVVEAARGTGVIAENVQALSTVSEETSHEVRGIQGAACELQDMAGALQTLISRFQLKEGSFPAPPPRITLPIRNRRHLHAA